MSDKPIKIPNIITNRIVSTGQSIKMTLDEPADGDRVLEIRPRQTEGKTKTVKPTTKLPFAMPGLIATTIQSTSEPIRQRFQPGF
jgi:hypothetical protein